MAKSTKTPETANRTKTNKVADFTELFNILNDTVANKNALTTALNTHGYIANMRSKNANDFTTVNNDLYYQLTDGSRLFFGTNRKTIQLWLTDALYDLRETIIPDAGKMFFIECADSIRHHKTDKKIAFTVEWFNQFMTAYNAKFPVRFTDLTPATATETK